MEIRLLKPLANFPKQTLEAKPDLKSTTGSPNRRESALKRANPTIKQAFAAKQKTEKRLTAKV
ncbi:hypothetical protein L484_002104 [Morus notabilis]|uniref:Uncharacterized protein n=1 Tax=Morus notabilis TaxID=981085 RepID=W9R3S2_9ROSA|nr:hypothetical protein L484_002104 [Morus notabilis]